MREEVTGGGTAVVAGTITGVSEAGTGVNVNVAVCVVVDVRVTVGVSDAGGACVNVGGGVLIWSDG